MYQLYKSLSESVQPISDSPVEVLTLCPCPPEVSEHIPDTDKAETDGGILYSLSESLSTSTHFCLSCSQDTFNSCLDNNNGYCDECYSKPEQAAFNDYSESRFIPPSYIINGCSQSLNLE